MIFRLLIFGFLLVANTKAASLVDYLKELPAEQLGWILDSTGQPPTPDERVKRLKVRDEKNGYLEMSSDGFSGDFGTVSLALFKRKSKSPLVAVADDANLWVYEKNGVKWDNVTQDVLPRSLSVPFINDKIREKSKVARARGRHFDFSNHASEHLVFYKLPREGTTIRALCGVGDPGIYGVELFKLKFQNEHFVITDR